jgi:hypothetical protein|tara:strand:+ start:167 stop:340 length:174 start_codon:yes stop_codon:yes gene_type:complete
VAILFPSIDGPATSNDHDLSWIWVQNKPIATLILGPESMAKVFSSTQFGGIHVVSVE